MATQLMLDNGAAMWYVYYTTSTDGCKMTIAKVINKKLLQLEAQTLADDLLKVHTRKNAIQVAVMNVTRFASDHQPLATARWQTTLKILRERH